MKVLQGLEPASVFGFFEDICNIPHISYHEKQLSDYCVAFAKERNLYYEQDEMGNVIIIGEATPGYEDVEPIIIQGHLDMVGDKLPSCPIDMEKEPIKVMIDGDYLTADGTTLTITGGKIIALNEKGEESIAVRNSTVTGTVTVSDTTDWNEFWG